jgi:hypothetical protein
MPAEIGEMPNQVWSAIEPVTPNMLRSHGCVVAM